MARPLAGPQSLLRSLSGRAILEALARSGPQTRAELAAATGLSRTAVAQVLKMLDGMGAVMPAGVDRGARGITAGRVALHPGLGHAAAVHVDHHGVHVALVDAAGTVQAEKHELFPRGADRAAHIAAVIAECGRSAPGPLHLAAVGVPGIVTPDGGIRNDLGPDGGAFRAALSAQLGCPVRIENDVNLAALAELGDGAGKTLSSFTLLMLDDGLGAGTVIDGVLLRGFSGVAGEVMYVPQTPIPIGAPVLGDVVVQDLALTHGLDPQAPLETHLEAAAHGDDAALRVAAEIGRRLVLVAGTVGLVLDPEAFILGGTAAHPVLVEAVDRVAREYEDQLPLRFVTAAFGPEAPLVGAIGEAASALRATVFTRILTPAERPRR